MMMGMIATRKKKLVKIISRQLQVRVMRLLQLRMMAQKTMQMGPKRRTNARKTRKSDPLILTAPVCMYLMHC